MLDSILNLILLGFNIIAFTGTFFAGVGVFQQLKQKTSHGASVAGGVITSSIIFYLWSLLYEQIGFPGWMRWFS